MIQNDIMAHPSRLNSVIARAVDGSKFKLEWYHKNYLDHVYAVSDDSGDILEHYRYTAFGEVSIYNSNGNQVSETQIDNHILWNTRRRDELTGYYMYKFRHYSAELGRWLARDPIEEHLGLKALLDSGIALYSFTRNNPLSRWDVYGLSDSPDEIAAAISWCGEEVDKFWDSPEVKRLRNAISKTPCKATKTKCVCCERLTIKNEKIPKGAKAFHFYDLDNLDVTTTYICATRGNGNNIKHRMLHELVHQLDQCRGEMGSCEKSACSEVRAYEAQGLCNSVDPSKRKECIKWGARRSMLPLKNKSCAGKDLEQVLNDAIEKCFEDGVGEPGFDFDGETPLPKF